MDALHLSRYVATNTVLFSFLAGCGGMQVPSLQKPAEAYSNSTILRAASLGDPLAHATLTETSSISRRQFVDERRVKAPGGNQVIVSDYGGNTVTVFDSAGKETAQLTARVGLNGPQGLKTDTAGTLYVANTLARNILIFRKPYVLLPQALPDATDYYPSDVAYDESTGIIAAINRIHFENSIIGAGSVSLFAKHANRPCVTLTTSPWIGFDYGAFNKSGDLYLDGQSSSGAVLIGIVRGGCKATAITTLSYGNSIIHPGGVAILKGGDVLVVDDSDAAAIYTYKPASGDSLGSPVATTYVKNGKRPFPLALAIMSNDKRIWATDFINPNESEYKYPAGGAAAKRISYGITSHGIAVNPVQVP